MRSVLRLIAVSAVVALAAGCGTGTDTEAERTGQRVTLGGPPECEERETCLVGLRETYGLTDLAFQAIPETAARVASLEEGDIQVALLFSTQPVIKERNLVALEDTEGIIAAENIVPVVGDEIVDAYGDEFSALMDDISENITTDALIDLNGEVELEARDPDDVATEWLETNGFPATRPDDVDAKDGPTIVFGSFNFPESLILAEIYAQAADAAGYPVEKKLDLGSREVIYPSLTGGEIDFLPEYIGSALSAGFEMEAPAAPDEGAARLQDAFASEGVTVLSYAPGEDKNVFVVTQAYAEEHDLSEIGDLADVV